LLCSILFPYTTLFRSFYCCPSFFFSGSRAGMVCDSAPSLQRAASYFGPNPFFNSRFCLLKTFCYMEAIGANGGLRIAFASRIGRSEEHTSELQSLAYL